MLAFGLLLGNASASAVASGAPGKATVVWVSIDGLRADYPGRGEYPFFQRLAAEGATSRRLVPTFPSITFSSHCSEATGVPVVRHGIIGNTIFDPGSGRLLKFPPIAGLLLAEPIWHTAARQGVGTLVFDWPLSQAQQGPLTATLFHDKFDPSLSDEARLTALMTAWKSHAGPEPLRLVMGYVVGPDSLGHQKGPDAPEIDTKLRELDRHLAAFFDEAHSHWQATAGPGDTFRFLLTTDHGMAPVRMLANLELILGSPIPPDVFIATNGNVGSVHLDKIADPAVREDLLRRYEERLKNRDYLTFYRRAALPERWQFAHPTRSGDLTIVLANGWCFSRQLPRETFPVEDAGGPRGMHGYDPAECPEMLGWMAVWTAPDGGGRRDLGEVDALRLHPTVAGWLGIQPAPGAEAKPLP